MADQYGLFWNSVDSDRLYDADSFAEWLRKFFTTGVFDGELQVTSAGGMDVSVSSGYSNIEGKVRFFDSSTKLTLAAAGATYPRIDTVVVERNDTDRKITIKAITGTYSANPTAPAPVRANNIYQIVLAQIYVAAGATAITQAAITDTRKDTSLCGIVAATIKNPDFGQWYAQNEAQFSEWFEAMKGQLTTDAAGNLQTEIDAVKKSVADNASSIASNKTAIDANTQKLVTTSKNITLSASGWINYDGWARYIIADSLVTSDSNQEVIPNGSINKEQYKALQRAELVGTQEQGKMYLWVYGTTPTIDIPITVIFRGEK